MQNKLCGLLKISIRREAAWGTTEAVPFTLATLREFYSGLLRPAES